MSNVSLLPARARKSHLSMRMTAEPVHYPDAMAEMEAHVDAIIAGTAPEEVWLVEHPPVFTAGASAQPSDLLDPHAYPIYTSSRGGKYTYHGPGQRIAYVMLDLRDRRRDVRGFVADLEEWMIRTLLAFGLEGVRRAGRVGVWVVRNDGSEAKIAAVGVRIRRWVTFHGVALNVSPDLTAYDGIIPCGISGHGVTSMLDLGVDVPMEAVDKVLRREFGTVFGTALS